MHAFQRTYLSLAKCLASIMGVGREGNFLLSDAGRNSPTLLGIHRISFSFTLAFMDDRWKAKAVEKAKD